jgi:hypothetical protein
LEITLDCGGSPAASDRTLSQARIAFITSYGPLLADGKQCDDLHGYLFYCDDLTMATNPIIIITPKITNIPCWEA